MHILSSVTTKEYLTLSGFNYKYQLNQLNIIKKKNAVVIEKDTENIKTNEQQKTFHYNWRLLKNKIQETLHKCCSLSCFLIFHILLKQAEDVISLYTVKIEYVRVLLSETKSFNTKWKNNVFLKVVCYPSFWSI